MEKEEWKTFRNALDKLYRKKSDEMFDISIDFTFQLAPILCSNLASKSDFSLSGSWMYSEASLFLILNVCRKHDCFVI
jgi:hypothetical protein